MKILICSLVCLCLCSCQIEKEDDWVMIEDTSTYTETTDTIISMECFQMKELYIIDERWQATENAGFNYREDGTYPHEYVYVIGTTDGEEVLTARKPNTKIEWRE